MVYLQLYNNKHVLSSHSRLKECVPLDCADLYTSKVPLYAPWYRDSARGHLKRILRRTETSTLLEDVVNLYVFSDDALTEKLSVPREYVIERGGRPQVVHKKREQGVYNKEGFRIDNVQAFTHKGKKYYAGESGEYYDKDMKYISTADECRLGLHYDWQKPSSNK